MQQTTRGVVKSGEFPGYLARAVRNQSVIKAVRCPSVHKSIAADPQCARDRSRGFGDRRSQRMQIRVVYPIPADTTAPVGARTRRPRRRQNGIFWPELAATQCQFRTRYWPLVKFTAGVASQACDRDGAGIRDPSKKYKNTRTTVGI